MYWTQDLLRSHYANPQNRGELACADFTSEMSNPSCGDAMQMSGMIQDGILKQVLFQGTGCVITIATASLLTQAVTEKTLEEILLYDVAFVCDLLKIELGPVRARCALLPLQTLQDGIRSYQVRILTK